MTYSVFNNFVCPSTTDFLFLVSTATMWFMASVLICYHQYTACLAEDKLLKFFFKFEFFFCTVLHIQCVQCTHSAYNSVQCIYLLQRGIISTCQIYRIISCQWIWSEVPACFLQCTISVSAGMYLYYIKQMVKLHTVLSISISL